VSDEVQSGLVVAVVSTSNAISPVGSGNNLSNNYRRMVNWKSPPDDPVRRWFADYVHLYCPVSGLIHRAQMAFLVNGVMLSLSSA